MSVLGLRIAHEHTVTDTNVEIIFVSARFIDYYPLLDVLLLLIV